MHLLKFDICFCLFLVLIRLQSQESLLAQSQTCVQELTNELRNRCLELRELSRKEHDKERLLQVRTASGSVGVLVIVILNRHNYFI